MREAVVTWLEMLVSSHPVPPTPSQVQEADRALESKRAMVRHLGHEVRTPLNIVAVGAEIIAKELSALGRVVPASVREVVTGIGEACSR